MKRLFIFLQLFCFINILPQSDRIERGNLVMENIPEVPQRIVDKVFQYQNVRSARFADWLPGKQGMLIGTRFGETGQIHYVAMPGGARQQLTFFNEPVGNLIVCPDKTKDMFLFTKDVGGGEFYQIYTFNIDDGSFQMLTDGKSRNGLLGWSNKGDKFAFSSTRRNGTDNDIYVSSIDDVMKVQPIIAEGGEWAVFDWSDDDSELIVVKYVSANESYIYTYNLNTNELIPFNKSNQNISYGAALFAKDKKGIIFTSDENSEFIKLKYYDRATKKITVLTPDINWDVEELELSQNSDKLVFTVNVDGLTKAYMMDMNTMKYKPLDVPEGIVGGFNFSYDDKMLGFTVNTPQLPGDAFSINLDDNKMERWTFSEVGGLNTHKFVKADLIHYPTFDNREIPAFVFKPKGKGPFPVIINIHGGPESQFQPGFSSLTQYFVNEMGIAMVAPNVRGSTGYGKTYLAMDNGFKREESVQDIGKLIEWIKKQPDLDGNRICVYGGSYGGYMVLSTLTHYSNQLKCGIDVVGISNFVTFLNNTQSYRRDLRRVEYGDEREPKMKEFLTKISPSTNASKITIPLFVIQGFNDPRVPVTEAEQILNAVKKNGVKTWYLMAKDEGHGFQKKSNRDFQTNAMIMFLEENLLK